MQTMKNQLNNYANQLIKKFENTTVCFGFKDNICGADLADMQLISKFDKEFRFLSCIIDIFSKYAWVVPLKDKKGITITIFEEVLKESNRKRNKVWVDKGSEFYNSFFKTWLKDDHIQMYLIHNEEKSVAAEIFIRTLKTKPLNKLLQYRKMCMSINQMIQ